MIFYHSYLDGGGSASTPLGRAFLSHGPIEDTADGDFARDDLISHRGGIFRGVVGFFHGPGVLPSQEIQRFVVREFQHHVGTQPQVHGPRREVQFRIGVDIFRQTVPHDAASLAVVVRGGPPLLRQRPHQCQRFVQFRDLFRIFRFYCFFLV